MNPDQNPTPGQQPMGNNTEMKNPLETMMPGEHVIFQIKRHPIGIIGIYVALGVVLTILAVGVAVAPSVLGSSDSGDVTRIGWAAFIIVAIVSMGFALISNIVYWGNAWILTSDSVTQVIQTSLFNKQSSQLSLESLEDVTVEQNGILAHMFNYGVLKAETAGERSKFTFLYCPTPNIYAKKILEARELFEQEGRYQAEHYQQGQVVPGSAQFTGQPAATIPQAPPANPQQPQPIDPSDQPIS